MSAFTVATTPLAVQTLLEERRASVVVTGTASYDTNGSTVNVGALPSACHGMEVLSVSAHGSAKYRLVYTPAGSYAPATGKIKVFDISTDPAAEVSSTTDLSATTWVVEFVGK